MKVTSILTGMLAVLALFASVAGAAERDRKDILSDRFAARAAELRDLKDDGKIGETDGGMIAAVKEEFLSDAVVKNMIEEENADRTELYALIAAEQKLTPEQVAHRSGERYIARAKKGDWLQREGKWEQK
jgi:uncharacterized protein YdbL (DUF1318 family)